MKFKWWVDGLDGGGVADTQAEAIVAAHSAIAELSVASLEFSVAPAMHVVDKLPSSAYITLVHNLMVSTENCLDLHIEQSCNIENYNFDKDAMFKNKEIVENIKNFLKSHMTGDVYHADLDDITKYTYTRGRDNSPEMLAIEYVTPASTDAGIAYDVLLKAFGDGPLTISNADFSYTLSDKAEFSKVLSALTDIALLRKSGRLVVGE